MKENCIIQPELESKSAKKPLSDRSENLPAWNDFDFEMKFKKGEVTDEELQAKVGKMIDELWSGSLSPVARYEYYDDVQFLYQGFDRYKNYLVKRLDFANEERAADVVKTVFFLQSFFYHSRQEWMTAEEFNKHAEEIKNKLNEAVQEMQGSYFLNMLAKDLLNQINSRLNFFEESEKEYADFIARCKKKYGDDWESHIEEEQDIEEQEDLKSHFENSVAEKPFLISPDIYAIRQNGRIMIAETSNYGAIHDLLRKAEEMARITAGKFEEGDINKSEETYYYELQKKGNVYNELTYDALEELAESWNQYFKKELDLSALAEKDILTTEQKIIYQNSFRDFQYLQEDFFRDLIKKELDVNLSDLTLKEQFYFLMLAKNIKEKDVAPLKKFVRMHGLKVLKSFFNIEKGQNVGDKIKMAAENIDQEELYWLMAELNCLFTAEEIRGELNNVIGKEENKNTAEKLKVLYCLISPNGDKKAIHNLQKFYENNIRFEEYKVNEKMNESEVALLEKTIGKDEKVLEMGCGAGRIISKLSVDGYDVTGYDFTRRHVALTKEALESAGQKAKVFQGDWHNNALKDESFDSVYSLGRNILHDYSVLDQIQLFQEAARILKSGGKFIFDIPNREKGGYKKMVDGYAAEMKRRGINNFRYGTIYDSPDGKFFATRYAYSHEDIKELATLAGFEIQEIKKQPLETGQDDENWYYILKKKNEVTGKPAGQ